MNLLTYQIENIADQITVMLSGLVTKAGGGPSDERRVLARLWDKMGPRALGEAISAKYGSNIEIAELAEFCGVRADDLCGIVKRLSEEGALADPCFQPAFDSALCDQDISTVVGVLFDD